jgi:hypothetical protein
MPSRETSSETQPEGASRGILNGGLLTWVQISGAHEGPNGRTVSRGAILAVLIGWLPLVILSAIAGGEALPALLHDCGVHARFLIAAPLFIIADAFCTPRLNAIALHFREAGLVPQDQVPRFDAAVASTRALALSGPAGIVIVAAAYVVVAIVALTASPEIVPRWHRSPGTGEYTTAGWWHVLVSLPLHVSLFFAWLWRVALWARLLRRIADLDLRLIPVHPDRTGGLLFVGYSVRAFSIVALPIGTVGAGSVANSVLRNGVQGFADGMVIVVMLVTVLVMFVAPLLVFTESLQRAWRRGVFSYGALAARVGEEFERKWFAADAKVGEAALEAPDFSAATDLYQVASNINGMRFVPIDWASLLLLIVSVLVSLVPVVLLAIPADRLAAVLKSLLF